MSIYKHLKRSIWIPSEFNNGWRYIERVAHKDSKKKLLELLASKYKHSSSQKWYKRIKGKEVKVNNIEASANQVLHCGDLIYWDRPPWEEPGVPACWDILFDNGDVQIINKPSGLPTTPGGGFLMHTLTALLDLKYKQNSESLVPKPLHRLGRSTSGLLICARQRATRANLSALFRNNLLDKSSFRRVYRALAQPNPNLKAGESIEVNTPIEMCAHPILNQVWNIQQREQKNSEIAAQSSAQLNASSKLKLLEKRCDCDLLEITIFTGRPHQIRIHVASIGTPLIGDRLYGPKGKLSSQAIPGHGGYLLHAYKLLNVPIGDKIHSFKSSLPAALRISSKRT